MLTQPLLVGVDYGRDDMIAITILRQSLEAQSQLHLIAKYLHLSMDERRFMTKEQLLELRNENL